MSFNKRILSKSSLRSFAKNDFQSFQTYMTAADAYMFSGDKEVYNIWNNFNEAEADGPIRKVIHEKLKNEEL